jgi:hypothetical protein
LFFLFEFLRSIELLLVFDLQLADDAHLTMTLYIRNTFSQHRSSSLNLLCYNERLASLTDFGHV